MIAQVNTFWCCNFCNLCNTLQIAYDINVLAWFIQLVNFFMAIQVHPETHVILTFITFAAVH